MARNAGINRYRGHRHAKIAPVIAAYSMPSRMLAMMVRL